MFSERYAEELKSINEGDDYPARARLAAQVREVLDASERGEIGLADFESGLCEIIMDCRIFSTNFEIAERKRQKSKSLK